MSILVIAAHPDDETLGCGGTMARHAAEGEKVYILILGEGGTARHSSRTEGATSDVTNQLRTAAEHAGDELGAAEVLVEGLPDNRFDSIDLLDIAKVIERELVRTTPHTVYTHHACDLNEDHRLTNHAARIACRPLPGSTVRSLYTFETLSSTEWGEGFQPQFFADISAQLDVKLRALAHYETEMRSFPHPRSPEAVRALAQTRGATVGVDAAEAFGVTYLIR